MSRKNVISPDRFQIGKFWLWYRSDRNDWNICWLDGRTTRRQSTGVGGGCPDSPPDEAKEALAKHALADSANARETASTPIDPDHPGSVLLAEVTAQWLVRHVAHLEDPQRYIDSVENLNRFWSHLDRRGEAPNPLTVGSIKSGVVDKFIAFRREEGATAPTISRDLAALRGPMRWAVREEIISHAPYVKDVKGKDKKKELEYDLEQIAALLEAAWALPERRHVHLFTMIHCSTHGRTEAILELNADTQIKGGLIHFNAPGRDQTRKKRSIVPITATLWPWLADVKGKVIKYKVATSEKARAAGAPEFYERPTATIRNAFAHTLIAAHERNPDLLLAVHETDAKGNEIWLPPRAKLGEVHARPQWKAIGCPNTLRHTIHTWHQRQGVPQAQIDAAAGHDGEDGSGKNYTHLRPEYLKDFMASTEAFWDEIGKLTQVHLRYQCDTKLVSFASIRTRRT